MTLIQIQYGVNLPKNFLSKNDFDQEIRFIIKIKFSKALGISFFLNPKLIFRGELTLLE